MSERTLYSLVAEFDTTDAILNAAESSSAAGYTKHDVYSPFPIHGMEDKLKQPFTRLPWLVFAVGATGGIGGFTLQTWTSTLAYPLNIGGKPLFSWPAFIPVTFECTILCAAFAAVIGMLLFNRLPQPFHPVFDAPNFERATVDRFFLEIQASDPRFDPVETRKFLEGLDAVSVSNVELPEPGW